mgnify:CR=1 FL=1
MSYFSIGSFQLEIMKKPFESFKLLKGYKVIYNKVSF